ncbi:MAG: histidine triad protein [Candidatus Adlerbacteria bacterium]|nr:histidine triad protein [Candidatus Adlerbacteria bacterium]
MEQTDCIFCKIVAGDIPSRKVHHEDESVVSFLDINPQAAGHTLVIPTEHYTWFQDMPDAAYDNLMRASKRIARELKAEHKADFIKLRIDGRDVPHVHVHLIPQFLQKSS